MKISRSVSQIMAIAVGVVCIGALMCHSETRAEGQPNIIYILADDLGYGDLGCYGQTKIKTPRLDELAAQGMRFTQHYSGSTVCAPSRCSLLTGLHTGHTRIRGNRPALLTPDDLTVAEVLKAAGYDTTCIGKWGVGHPPPPGDPANNGFDYFFGYLDMYHAHNHFPDFLWKNGSKIPLQGNVVKVIDKGGVALKRSQYSHDLFTNEAVSFIEAHANSTKPFFLYLPFTIPHANNEAGNEGMEVPNDAPYTLEKWPQAQKNHAAMISLLDTSVGKIVSLLDNLKISEKTLIIFTSDNGPHKEGGADPQYFKSSGTLRGIKRDLYEGGIRVPFIARWTGKIKPGSYSDHVSAFWDFLPTACELAEAKVPANIDGISYLPTLLGQPKKQKQHNYLYWEFHEGGSQQAVRMGDWKLVRVFGGQTELFDLKTDPAEKQNVAADHPDVVQMIETHLKTARTTSKAFPLAPRKPKKQPAPPKVKQ